MKDSPYLYNRNVVESAKLGGDHTRGTIQDPVDFFSPSKDQTFPLCLVGILTSYFSHPIISDSFTTSLGPLGLVHSLPEGTLVVTSG